MTRCSCFRPDHNGECLNCDEWIDAHSEAAIQAGAALVALVQRLRTWSAAVTDTLLVAADLQIVSRLLSDAADALDEKRPAQ